MSVQIRSYEALPPAASRLFEAQGLKAGVKYTNFWRPMKFVVDHFEPDEEARRWLDEGWPEWRDNLHLFVVGHCICHAVEWVDDLRKQGVNQEQVERFVRLTGSLELGFEADRWRDAIEFVFRGGDAHRVRVANAIREALR